MSVTKPGRAARRTTKETLQALLLDSGTDEVVVERRALLIDDDGTYFRVTLEDGSTRLYREFANTTGMLNDYMTKEAMLSQALRGVGLPVPELLGELPGSPWAGGDPAALLFEDFGGEPLALYGGHRKVSDRDLFMAVDAKRADALWRTIGAMLARLHQLDLSHAGRLAEPEWLNRRNPRLRKQLTTFGKVLTEVAEQHPAARTAVEELLSLRKPLADYMNARPVAIRTGDAFFPSMFLERDGKTWQCATWVGWGYYAEIGDAMRDVATIEAIHVKWTGEHLPSSFYEGYGLPLDTIVLEFMRVMRQCRALTVKWGPNHHKRGYVPTHPEVIDPAVALPASVDRLRAAL